MNEKKSDVLRKTTLGGSILAAISAGLCCVGPLVAALLGAGGFAAASAFARWRPLFLVLTFALLALSWYLTYRKPKESCATDGEGATCPTRPAGRWNKIVLGIATVVAIAFAAFPNLSGAFGKLRQSSSPTGAIGTNSAVLNVSIPTMDCAACAASIEKTVRRQKGVEQAQVNFDTKQGVIYYDPSRTSSNEIIATIDKTGFKAVAPNAELKP